MILRYDRGMNTHTDTTALKPCPRCARRARWARILARAAVPVSIGAAIGAMIPTP